MKLCYTSQNDRHDFENWMKVILITKRRIKLGNSSNLDYESKSKSRIKK